MIVSVVLVERLREIKALIGFTRMLSPGDSNDWSPEEIPEHEQDRDPQLEAHPFGRAHLAAEPAAQQDCQPEPPGAPRSFCKGHASDRPIRCWSPVGRPGT